MSAVTAVVLVAVAVIGAVAANNLRSRTERIRDNTGPVLVTTQSLIASLAEADAAATAAFLSGAAEDREQRRLYEQALARSAVQLEEVSSLAGGDEDTHAALRSLAVKLSTYAGMVEKARAENQAAVPRADDSLLDAVTVLAGAINDDAAKLTDTTQDRFDRDRDRRTTGVYIVGGLAAIALAVLVLVQLDLFRRSRRVLNVPLVAATVLVLVAVVWLVNAASRSSVDLEDARDQGYQSIALTANIQKEGLRAKAAETIALITGDDAQIEQADIAAAGLSADEGLLRDARTAADSARERRAVEEMSIRWDRYRESVEQLRRLGDDEARVFAVGPASSTFTGFNVSVESVLGDNRTQFRDGLESASSRLDWIEWIVLALPLLAAAGALLGFQLRINEYQ